MILYEIGINRNFRMIISPLTFTNAVHRGESVLVKSDGGSPRGPLKQHELEMYRRICERNCAGFMHVYPSAVHFIHAWRSQSWSYSILSLGYICCGHRNITWMQGGDYAPKWQTSRARAETGHAPLTGLKAKKRRVIGESSRGETGLLPRLLSRFKSTSAHYFGKVSAAAH